MQIKKLNPSVDLSLYKVKKKIYININDYQQVYDTKKFHII